MKSYLVKHKLYVKNQDNFIYQTESIEMHDGENFMTVELKLVAGYDYINPDYSDVQGYVPADRFVESLQDEYELVYFLQESVRDSLIDNGYEILKELPTIHGVQKEEEIR